MFYEQLTPDELWLELEAKCAKLEKLLKSKTKSLEKAPKGTLRISKSHRTTQYYWINGAFPQPQKAEAATASETGETEKAENAVSASTHVKKGKYYLKKTEDQRLIKSLAQKEYDFAAVALLKEEITWLRRYLRHSTPSVSDAAKRRLSPGKAKLAEPLTLTDAEYAERWLSEEYCTKGIAPGNRSFETASGLQVRSKSESIIAEVLTAMHIPFRYEPELQLKDYTVHPDFLCLNVRTRQELIWEHRGMMDDADYATKSVSRLIQ